MALTLQLLADLSHNERFRSAMPDPSLWDINLDMEQHPYGWLSLVPPLVAILLAILTRRILISLLLAILSGALILTFYDAPQNLMESPPAFGGLVPGAVVDGWNVLVQGLADSWNDHLWPTLINPDKISVFVFTCLMGAIVGMVNRAAGMRGLLQLLSPVTGSVRRAQVTAWFSGMLVFFDDYANTMLLGTTFRSMFDRLKISREKLAYIVDSTAAPVAGLAIVSTWIAGELDYIKSGLGGASELNPFDLFLQSIPYRFYVLWALFFVVLLALTRRDFGPMLKAEVRARREGEQEDERGNAEFLLPTDMDWNRMELKPGDLDDRTIEALAVAHDSTLAPSGTRARSLNAILPILVTVVAILWFMFQSGVQDVGPLPTTPKTQASALIEGVVIAQPVGNFSTANPPSLQTQDEATGDANESIPDGGADAATTDGGGNETTTAVAAGPTAWEVTQWLRDVFGASNSYTSLVWGSLVGFFFTLIWLSAQRIVPFVGLSQAAGRGAAHMVPALMVLWLASALSAMTSNDPTPAYAEELARAKTMAGAIAGIEQIRSFDDLSQLERVHETLHLNHLDRAAIIQALAPAYSDPELFMRNVTDRVNDIQPDGSFYARYLFQNGRQVDWNEAVKDAELPVANPKDEVPESSSAPKVTLPDLDPPPRPKQADDGSAEARPVLGGGAPGGRRPGGGRPGGPGAGGPGAGGPGAGGGRPPGGAPGGGAQGGGGGARGMSAMFAGQGPAEPDLTEAWSPEGNLEFPFADFRHRLHTGNYLSSLLTRQADSVESASGSHPLSPWLPTIIFVLAGFTAFATGSSWGTMGIVMPLAIPLAMSMLTGSETDIASSSIFLATIGSVLAGAVFGDHCSPISDTTVLSSQASGCDHLAHVWTQMPYALTVGLITILFGTIPVGFGFPWQLCLVLGTVALVVVALFMGRTVDSVISGEDERSTDTAAPSGSTQTESN